MKKISFPSTYPCYPTLNSESQSSCYTISLCQEHQDLLARSSSEHTNPSRDAFIRLTHKAELKSLTLTLPETSHWLPCLSTSLCRMGGYGAWLKAHRKASPEFLCCATSFKRAYLNSKTKITLQVTLEIRLQLKTPIVSRQGSHLPGRRCATGSAISWEHSATRAGMQRNSGPLGPDQ